MKVYKCKYCGKPIRFEKDRSGRTRAVERSVYYEPDMHGELTVLTMRGEVVRAREVRGATRVGSVLHPQDCGGVSRYVIAAGVYASQRKRRRGLVATEMRGRKTEPLPQTEKVFYERTSLF